jgi:hypoxanthine phosphoribosyltransferase
MKYTWNKFDEDVQKIAQRISPLWCKNIYGIPRGGLVLAVKLSYLCDIPLLIDKEKITYDTLVVDDISDSGKTLKEFKEKGCIVMTIYYHKNTILMPDFCLREKKSEWITFPWEKDK